MRKFNNEELQCINHYITEIDTILYTEKDRDFSLILYESFDEFYNDYCKDFLHNKTIEFLDNLSLEDKKNYIDYRFIENEDYRYIEKYITENHEFILVGYEYL